MRKPTPTETPAAEASAPTMPSKGGSYIRKADGSLERVEFTEHRPPAAEPVAEAPSKGAAPETPAQEG